MRTLGIAAIAFVAGIFLSETLFGRGDSGLWAGSIVIALACAAVAAAVVRQRSGKA